MKRLILSFIILCSFASTQIVLAQSTNSNSSGNGDKCSEERLDSLSAELESLQSDRMALLFKLNNLLINYSPEKALQIYERKYGDKTRKIINRINQIELHLAICELISTL